MDNDLEINVLQKTYSNLQMQNRNAATKKLSKVAWAKMAADYSLFTTDWIDFH